ncbi:MULTISPECIES: hypothetical protein [Bradyrhizobium]|nr:hypothetical protein [Bradyrhizobium vignae]
MRRGIVISSASDFGLLDGKAHGSRDRVGLKRDGAIGLHRA